jgi:uncharacterized protein (TIGR03067 family)
LAELINSAVRRLPEVYRAAVIACDLEGLSRAEAASRLGWKEGTLSGRLARARQLLAERLRRMGVMLPAGGIGTVLAIGETVSAEFAADTVRLGVGLAAGNLLTGLSAPVAALTEGMVRGMFLAKCKFVAVALLVVGTLGFGMWSAAGMGGADGPGLQKAADEKANAAAKAQGQKSGLNLDVARGDLGFARKYLADMLTDQQEREKRGGWPVDTPDQLQREIARFQADVATLESLLKDSQTALATARAVGPEEKVSADLIRMQGRWRVDTIGDGKNQQPMPVKTAPVFEIVGNKWYLVGPAAMREQSAYTLVLRPDKKPAELDLVNEKGEVAPCIYRFAGPTEPRAGNLWIAKPKRVLSRPTSFEVDFNEVEVAELTRVEEKTDADKDRVDGVDVRVPRIRRELVRQELQLWLAEDQNEKPATTLEELENQLARKKARLEAAQRLLADAQVELDKEKARATKAGAKSSAKPHPDLEKMQGMWHVEIEPRAKGDPTVADDPRLGVLEVKGDRMTVPYVQHGEGVKVLEVEIDLDPDKDPKQIDLSYGSKDRFTLPGIYKFVEPQDKKKPTLLVMALGTIGSRPRDFNTQNGGVMVYRLTRVADQKPPAGAAEPDEAERLRKQRLRAAVELRKLQDEVAVAEAALNQATRDTRDATVRYAVAQEDLAQAKARLAKAESKFEELSTDTKSAVGVVVRDDKGKVRSLTADQTSHIQSLASAMLGDCSSELTGTGKGKPFATGELWDRLEQSGHVTVTFAGARIFKGVGNNAEVTVEAILIPVSASKAPDYVLVRHGKTYLAFFAFRDEQAAELRKFIADLK